MNSILISLLNVESITSLLDSFTVGSTTYPAIVTGRKVPASFQEMNNILQLYRTSPIPPGDYQPESWTANCRRSTEQGAEELARAVRDILNREYYENDILAYFRCLIQPAIYEEDNRWNVPVEILIKNNQ